jgi:hypothetical protein
MDFNMEGSVVHPNGADNGLFFEGLDHASFGVVFWFESDMPNAIRLVVEVESHRMNAW